MTDTLVLPLAEALLTCLCDALQTTIGGPPCQCCLRPGNAPPPADACCACGSGSGQASVQVTRIVPVIAGKFPTLGTAVGGTLTNCTAFEWAAELTLTVYRCVAVADEEGFPSCDELTADARKIADDARAMRQAVLCCAWRNDELGDPRPIILGDWRPIEPQGGCAGGQMAVTVLAGPECCPPVV